MNKRYKYFHCKNENGYTLVTVLMIIMVFSVLGLSLMATSMNSVKMSAGEREDQSAFYIAEAALNTEKILIEDKINEAYNNSSDEITFYNNVLANISKNYTVSEAKFEKNSNVNPEAKISVEELNKINPREYKITSTGLLGNKKRVVEQTFTVGWTKKSTGFDAMAILVKENITLNSALISGNIASASSLEKSIIIMDGGVKDLNWKNYADSIFIPINHKGIAIDKPTWMKDIPSATKKELGGIPELPAFPDIPNYNKLEGFNFNYNSPDFGSSAMKLDKNSSLGKLEVDGSHTLIIDIGKGEKELVLDSLYLSGSGKIFIEGEGKLRIYVKNVLSISNGILNPVSKAETLKDDYNIEENSEHLKKLEIFYKGTDDFIINSNLKIYSSLYVEKAKILISGSGKIYGNILSGGSSFEVTGDGNIQPSLYFAPNADFIVSRSGKVSGTIIGKSIEVFGNGQIQYKPLILTEGFFAPGIGEAGKFEIKAGRFLES